MKLRRLVALLIGCAVPLGLAAAASADTLDLGTTALSAMLTSNGSGGGTLTVASNASSAFTVNDQTTSSNVLPCTTGGTFSLSVNLANLSSGYSSVSQLNSITVNSNNYNGLYDGVGSYTYDNPTLGGTELWYSSASTTVLYFTNYTYNGTMYSNGLNLRLSGINVSSATFNHTYTVQADLTAPSAAPVPLPRPVTASCALLSLLGIGQLVRVRRRV